MATSSELQVVSAYHLLTARRFVLAGGEAGIAVSLVLYLFLGPKTYSVVLGFQGTWHFFALPILAAAIAGLTGWLVSLLSSPLQMGWLLGSIVGVVSFVIAVLLLSLYVAGSNFLDVIAGFLLFGGIFFGWAILLVGGWVGIRIKTELDWLKRSSSL